MPPKSPKSDFDVVRQIGLSLPDVVHTTSARGEGLRVRGKLMACHAVHKSAEPHSIMVRMSADERDRLIAEDPRRFYITDHYEKHPAVLVRLQLVKREQLENVLAISWQYVFERSGQKP